MRDSLTSRDLAEAWLKATLWSLNVWCRSQASPELTLEELSQHGC